MIQVFNSISLYRNIVDYPYPIALTEERSGEVFSHLFSLFNDVGLIKEKGLLQFDALVSDSIKQELNVKFGYYDVKHNREIKSGVLFDMGRSLYIILNKGEHLTVMATDLDCSLADLFKRVNAIDDDLEKTTTFAFDEKYGYLMSDISLLGTGLIASSVLSLPCLHELAYIEKIIEASGQIGVVIENAFPSIKNNSFYRVSNKSTLGMSEKEIIENVDNVCHEIIKKEIDARETLIISKRLEMEDRIMKAYGRLKYSRLLSNEEMLQCMAMVKLGIYFKIIEDLSDHALNHIIHKQIEIENEELDNRLIGNMRFEEARSRMLRKIFEE